MRTFSVKNFERFQHYKDRSPPWIKLYNDVLDDYEFGQLPDASKSHLFAIWLLASRYENKIPADAEWVARRINATSPVNLAILEKYGFIVLEQACSDPLAPRKQDDCPEREGKTETEKKENSADALLVSEPNKAPTPTPRGELLAVLDADHAEVVLEHRQRLRKPLTAHAAKLLAGKFSQCADPNAAADAMIAAGWQGFEPAWLVGREHGRAPPSRANGGTTHHERLMQAVKDIADEYDTAAAETEAQGSSGAFHRLAGPGKARH